MNTKRDALQSVKLYDVISRLNSINRRLNSPMDLALLDAVDLLRSLVVDDMSCTLQSVIDEMRSAAKDNPKQIGEVRLTDSCLEGWIDSLQALTPRMESVRAREAVAWSEQTPYGKGYVFSEEAIAAGIGILPPAADVVAWAVRMANGSLNFDNCGERPSVSDIEFAKSQGKTFVRLIIHPDDIRDVTQE